MKTLLTVLAVVSFAAHADTRFLAHRGVAQQYDRTGLDRQACTASRMLPPTHGWQENTLASIEAAFAFGAEVVEIDIHPTVDGEFVLFHDWTVDCRTEGKGVTREQTIAFLKSLDIGYGYTADGGKTYPFRGKFRGAMPTWAEAMAMFPSNRFLVNIKSNDPREAELIAAYVERHRIDLSRLMFYGGDRPIAALRGKWPGVRTMSKATLKSCAWKHVLIGWSGYVPEDCRHSILFVPLDYQGWAWGWPRRFSGVMAEAGTEVAVIGPVGGGEAAGIVNIDDAEALGKVADGYRGLVSTDRIDVVGPSRLQPGVTPLDDENRPWALPVKPFRIAENLYYVGTAEIAVYAIRTPAGAIVLDTGLYQALPNLLENLRAVGIAMPEVKLLLVSHGHYDHVGGTAELKRLTGATLLASAPEAELLARGGIRDFAFGDRLPYPAVRVDRTIVDGEALELGGTVLVAHVTPGHTRGCTTWTMRVREGGRDLDVLFGCSYTAPGYRLKDNAAYLGIVADYRATFAKLGTLGCDIQLASHASFFDMEGKRARLEAGDALAFVDAAGCRAFIRRSAARFEEEAARQGVR